VSLALDNLRKSIEARIDKAAAEQFDLSRDYYGNSRGLNNWVSGANFLLDDLLMCIEALELADTECGECDCGKKTCVGFVIPDTLSKLRAKYE